MDDGTVRSKRIETLRTALGDLTDGQLRLFEGIIQQFNRSYIKIDRLDDSDIVDDCLLQDFGDTLRLHHSLSKEPFRKDRFEFALEQILNACGSSAILAPPGNPGHDIIINGQRLSLKTEAAVNIRKSKLHISKFMELGKGEWSDRDQDLIGLRNQFLAHMQSYDRILSLRCLEKEPAADRWYYEMVEIPKNLLSEAKSGSLRMLKASPQNPKPGYCDVKDNDGEIKFQLYFDGGTERKLQIRNLRKNLCTVHATWIFSTVGGLKT